MNHVSMCEGFMFPCLGAFPLPWDVRQACRVDLSCVPFCALVVEDAVHGKKRRHVPEGEYSYSTSVAVCCKHVVSVL